MQLNNLNDAGPYKSIAFNIWKYAGIFNEIAKNM